MLPVLQTLLPARASSSASTKQQAPASQDQSSACGARGTPRQTPSETEAVQLFRLAHGVSLVYLSLTTLSVHVCPPPVIALSMPSLKGGAVGPARASSSRCACVPSTMVSTTFSETPWAEAVQQPGRLFINFVDSFEGGLVPFSRLFRKVNTQTSRGSEETPSMHWIACNLS